MNDKSRPVLSTVLWSVLVGALGIILVVVFTDDPVEAFLVSALVVVFVLYLLPYQLAARWHYWAGTISIAVALAIYEWG
ncbi:MAG: hypothetical protein ABEJ92_05870 [Halobacteriales archaeon]